MLTRSGRAYDGDGDGDLRHRRPARHPAAALPPCLSESSISDNELFSEDPPADTAVVEPRVELRRGDTGRDGDGLSLRGIARSTALRKRLSRQSSLSWGHRPSRLVGASCLLFLLPVPPLLRACCPSAAFLLACVTVSSYLSDHVYTGLESWAHAVDRFLAPLALGVNVHAIYSTCGARWASLSGLAVACHVLANYHSKRGAYDEFVVWHSLWHAVGVGLILVALSVNEVAGTCWEGSGWEGIFGDVS